MKKAALMAAVVAMAWISSTANGQTPASGPATKAALPGGAMLLPSGGWGSYEEFFRVCELDKDQLKKVADIQAKRKDDLNSYYRAHADILAVLTAEQQTKWREFVILKEVKACYAEAKLTDEQWDKAVEACEKLAKDPGFKIGEVYTKVGALLTAEQKAKWLLSRAPLKDMDKVCHFTPKQIDDLLPVVNAQLKATAELEAQKPQLYKAERDALDAGDKTCTAIRPMWDDWHKREADAQTQFDEKLQSILTGKQKADWKAAGETKAPAKP